MDTTAAAARKKTAAAVEKMKTPAAVTDCRATRMTAAADGEPMETARRAGMGWTRRTKKPAILGDGDEDGTDAAADEKTGRSGRRKEVETATDGKKTKDSGAP